MTDLLSCVTPNGPQRFLWEGSEIRALRLPNPNVLLRATEDEGEPKSPSSAPVLITGCSEASRE
ncbi:hypothetical protein IRJ41_003449 [Triplophysa rosa]|uniref:Uncharacterized protein n=1 Tax=Triplophysa rosa TaxID=992332 RepID=A0A9W7TA79_TRIRA|nr:hypothetical protein IRJ41_003449 [Triplophysa rosa]